MSALRWALDHPSNSTAHLRTLGVYLSHQAIKRLVPARPLTLKVGTGAFVGPAAHPITCLVRYVCDGWVDAEVFVVYKHILRPGGHFLDVGANLGLHSVVAAQSLDNSGLIVAVEPDPAAIPWLERNLSQARVPHRVERQPVADRARGVGWASAGTTTSHLIADKDETVRTTTIDHLVRTHGLRPSELVIKLDIEGWEPAALIGARRTLGAGVRALVLEANGLQGRCPVSWGDAVGLLQSLNYRFVWPDLARGRLQEYHSPSTVSPSGNYLALKPWAVTSLASSIPMLAPVAG